MTTQATMAAWLAARDRLVGKGLVSGAGAGIALRCPGTTDMVFGAVDAKPALLSFAASASIQPSALLYATVLRLRPDIGAIAFGGGAFGNRLSDFGGWMPQVFDEQARHLGAMPEAVTSMPELALALENGCSVVLCHAVPLCMGVTPTRLVLNAELFEKCAKAYVIAAATGGRITTLPWLVRWIANGRLRKDEKRACLAYAAGQWPAESRSY